MECKWRPQARMMTPRRQSQPGRRGSSVVSPRSCGQDQDSSPVADTSPSMNGAPSLHAVDEVFDYASFMWDAGADFWQQVSPGLDQNVGLNTHVMVRLRLPSHCQFKDLMDMEIMLTEYVFLTIGDRFSNQLSGSSAVDFLFASHKCPEQRLHAREAFSISGQ